MYFETVHDSYQPITGLIRLLAGSIQEQQEHCDYSHHLDQRSGDILAQTKYSDDPVEVPLLVSCTDLIIIGADRRLIASLVTYKESSWGPLKGLTG